MSKNIVFEGWLTKSPPSKRIWRTKWRRRWFALRQSGELPGQYFLDYFADRNCRRLKGTINLDFCEQVDAGLHMERGSNGSLDPKLRGCVFTIQTQTRTYHLEADCEADMEKWVDAICRVCGLREIDDTPNTAGIYQNDSMTVGNQETIALRVVNENRSRRAGRRSAHVHYTTVTGRTEQHQPLVTNDNITTMTIENNNRNEGAESTGPYIPISECITGVREQDIQNAFTFDHRNIVISTKTPFERADNKRQIHMSQPQIRINNLELSENESNFSEDECRSLNASQSNIGDWTVAKTFTKLSLAPQRNNVLYDTGPPVPPRPPKTFAMSKDFSQKELLQAPKMFEPTEFHDNASAFEWIRVPRRMSHGNLPPSTGRCGLSQSIIRTTDDEDDGSVGHSMQYCNLSTLPPAVDRALKPRHSSCNVSSFNGQVGTGDEPYKSDVLHYLDLDLQPPSKTSNENLRNPTSIIHGKSSTADADSAYKTVDFLKTEAFNITRQDAEASRSNQQ